jgi:SPASM domain peptide maturase of grasp-with-spasm system
MLEDQDVVMLYANCIPVRGAKRSTICDLHNNTFQFIPNILFEILIAYKNKSIGFIKKKYLNEYDEIIESYCQFMIDNDLAFICKESDIERFPPIDPHWESPELITNCILDFNSSSNYNVEKIVNELSLLRCRSVELRFFDLIPLEHIESVISKFEGTEIFDLQIVCNYDCISEEYFQSLCRTWNRISLITLFNAPKNEPLELNQFGVTILFLPMNITSAAHCGIINPSYFNVNLDMYLESLKFNSCLNKKISVDVNGQIKNCPSMKRNFGSSDQTLISDVIQLDEFANLWTVTKDQVQICKDCEFRFICTDCRAFTVAENKLGKPLKCTYDPYSAKWL